MTHKVFVNDRLANCHDCGKASYSTRSAARLAIRRWHPGEHKQPYRCPVLPKQWHIGKLDERVARGELSKEERYRGAVA
jgi:hypothetical protein